MGPASASLRLSSALPRYRRARSLAFQALQIREASSAPPARFWTWVWSHTGLRKGIETKLKVSKTVRTQPHLHQKGELEEGPAAASLWLSSALCRYRRAKSLTFQALQIREASSAPPARFWTWVWSHTGLRKGIETKLKVSKTVRTKPHLDQKAELEEGPASASPWLSSALRRYRRAKSLSFQALQIGEASSAPQAPLLAVVLGSRWTAQIIKRWMKTLSGCIMNV